MTVAVTSSPSLQREIDAMEGRLRAHVALKELSDFGQLLASRALDARELKTFFATMGAFFKPVPTGILALALKVTDDFLDRGDRYGATAMGAHILYADVDEFGLHDLRNGLRGTHHQLFQQLTSHLGVTEQEMEDPRYCLPAGRKLGDATTEYYRHRSIGEALGFHLSSELTSSAEFVYFLNGFVAHKEHYRIKGEDDPVVHFFQVHTVVEPMHKSLGRTMIEIYAALDPATLKQVEAGAVAFMDGFAELFRALNQALSAPTLQAVKSRA